MNHKFCRHHKEVNYFDVMCQWLNILASFFLTGIEAFSSEVVPPFGGTCPVLATRPAGTRTVRQSGVIPLSHVAPSRARSFLIHSTRSLRITNTRVYFGKSFPGSYRTHTSLKSVVETRENLVYVLVVSEKPTFDLQFGTYWWMIIIEEFCF